jgi:hypothetical protein
MNENTPNTPPTTPTKRTRKPHAAAKPVPRVIDPEITRLRQEHSLRVKEYRGKAASAKILATMLTRLVQLTPEDKAKLADALPATTPALPL